MKNTFLCEVDTVKMAFHAFRTFVKQPRADVLKHVITLT